MGSHARLYENFLAPVDESHIWPRTAEGARVKYNRSTKKVVVTPKEIPVFGRGPALPAPDDREPLATIDEMQSMLLVKVRDQKNSLRKAIVESGDPYVEREHPRRNRLERDFMTPEAMLKYLEAMEECGTHYLSAKKAGKPARQFEDLKKKVPEFKLLCDEALARYRERLEHEAYRRGVQGWDEPVIGGRNKDQVVAVRTVYDSKALELLLKRHIPEYRDKFEGTITVQPGVLVVPSSQEDPEKWLEEHGAEKQMTDAEHLLQMGRKRVQNDAQLPPGQDGEEKSVVEEESQG